MKTSVRNILSLVSMIAMGMMTMIGCQSGNGYKTTPSGLQYKIIVDKPGDSASVGDFMKISIRKDVHDTTVLNTDNHPPGYRWVHLQESMGRKYDVMEGLLLLSKGDSAEFKLPVDSVKGMANTPPSVEKGDIIHYFIKVLDVKSREEFESNIAKLKKKQNETDAEIIKNYVDSLGASPKVANDGVNVIIHKEGEGKSAKDGQVVTILYTGKTLAGKVFDSNEDAAFHHTDPLVFTLGEGRMIPGIESGLKFLKEGSDATLIIPSSLAYGRRGRLPQIKPNAVLLFHVKVLDVKDA